MEIKNLIRLRTMMFAVAFLLMYSVSSKLVAQEAKLLPGALSINVIEHRTNSVQANSIARHFSQLLLLEGLKPLSSLLLEEQRSATGANVVSLSTPLRRISSHQFNSSMMRSWEPPAEVAQRFLVDAIDSGLITNQ